MESKLGTGVLPSRVGDTRPYRFFGMSGAAVSLWF